MKGNNKNMAVIIVVVAVILMVVIGLVGVIGSLTPDVIGPGAQTPNSGKSLDDLYQRISEDIITADPVKAAIDLSDSSLYDEVPDIDKYPLSVEPFADVVLEIFSSPEKAGESADKESWLIDVANDFNSMGVVTSDGRSCGIAVRNVSSGLAADYIISGKYVPELFSPSNALWGAMIQSKGKTINMECDRLVGNTAGVMVKKNLGYTDIDHIIEDVVSGKLNLGYTNPQTSSSGANLLLTILDKYGKGDLTSSTAVTGFTEFQKNIPYVAYNTNQMVRAAGVGSLDCMVNEYQSYINNPEFVKEYDFIPYGIRHDNPLYSCKSLSNSEQECLDKFIEFALGTNSQQHASECGFGGNDTYKSAFDIPAGGVIDQSLKIWKDNKDVGKEIIAVFVCDTSGSMDGTPILQLKESLTNGMKYISEKNYVGMVSYGSKVTKELDIAQFDMTQRSYFQGAVDRLSASGNTHTYEALCLAMKMVKQAQSEHPGAKCMIFLLSDGQANGSYSLNDVSYAIGQEGFPMYTIGYGEGADMDELGRLSGINEAASISADPEDVVYKLKSLFNAQL